MFDDDKLDFLLMKYSVFKRPRSHFSPNNDSRLLCILSYDQFLALTGLVDTANISSSIDILDSIQASKRDVTAQSTFHRLHATGLLRGRAVESYFVAIFER